MVHYTSLFLPLVALFPVVYSTGIFLHPTETDGSLTLRTGETINISWTNTLDYDILSLGYFSTSNQTITWIISNDISRPTSYSWSVDAVEKGFNLADSKLFAFYICKGYNFGDPFMSSYFVIEDEGVSDGTSTTLTRASATSATGAATTGPTKSAETTSAEFTNGIVSVTSTNPPTLTTPTNQPPTGTAASASDPQADPKETSMTTGTIAGVVVGVVLIIAITAGLITFFILRRKKQRQSNDDSSTKPASDSGLDSGPGSRPDMVSGTAAAGGTTGAHEKSQMQAHHTSAQDRTPPFVSEIDGSATSARSEMDGGGHKPVELADGRSRQNRFELSA